MKAFAAALLGTLLAPYVALGQVSTPVRPAAADSGRVVLETRLGGDSSQATTVNLRRGATYRVWLRPARADIRVRRLAHDTITRPPLDAGAVPDEDSTHASRAFNVVAREQGEHMVELTNPQVGATSVRIVFLHRAPDDTLPVTSRRRLLYNEATGSTGIIVELDSGRVYRVVSDGEDIFIAPRSGYMAPVRLAPLVRGGGSGAPFIAERPGEYRVYGGTWVRIYEEEADAQEIMCIRNPSAPGCSRGHRYTRGIMVALLAIPAIVLLNHFTHSR